MTCKKNTEISPLECLVGPIFPGEIKCRAERLLQLRDELLQARSKSAIKRVCLRLEIETTEIDDIIRRIRMELEDRLRARESSMQSQRNIQDS